MSSRAFFLLPLCFVSALALNAYAALDPTGVYQDYLEKLDAATPPVAAMATAAADGVHPWSEPKAPEPPPVPDPAPLPDPEPEPEPEEPDSPFTTVDASYFDDALFIGDSHTDGFKDYAGLNNADYLCHNGLTVWSAVEKAEFPGRQPLAQALGGKHYGKIYLMLGINELGAGRGDHHRIEHDMTCVMGLQPVRYRADEFRRRYHAELDRGRRNVRVHRVDLCGDHVRCDILHTRHAHRVLCGDRGDRAHAEHPVGEHGLQIGLNACAAGRITAGDGQHRRQRGLRRRCVKLLWHAVHSSRIVLKLRCF